MQSMRLLFALISLAFALPMLAAAQSEPKPYSNAPMVVVGDGQLIQNQSPQPAAAAPIPGIVTGDFPTNALSNATAHDGNPPNPATPAAGKTPATPATPNNPEAPDSPKSPLLKLWPRDAVKIFMPTCVKFHSELIEPCYCIITQVMEVIPHDEFLRLNEEGKMDTDPRIAAINERCLSKPRERKQ